MLIKIPNGRVLFLGGWRRWVPMLVVWFIPGDYSLEVRSNLFKLEVRLPG